MATVGSGDYRYERVPEWPNMPKYWAFGAASDGAVNSQDEVLYLQQRRPPAYHLGYRRQLHLILGRRHILRQPPRHLHRPQRQRLARRPRFPHRHRIHPRRRNPEDARRKTSPLALIPGRALQYALRPRHRPRRQYVRLRRLRRATAFTNSAPTANCSCLGASKAQAPANSPCSTTSGWTSAAESLSATAKTTASNSSTTAAISSKSGRIWKAPATSGSATTSSTS